MRPDSTQGDETNQGPFPSTQLGTSPLSHPMKVALDLHQCWDGEKEDKEERVIEQASPRLNHRKSISINVVFYLLENPQIKILTFPTLQQACGLSHLLLLMFYQHAVILRAPHGQIQRRCWQHERNQQWPAFRVFLSCGLRFFPAQGLVFLTALVPCVTVPIRQGPDGHRGVRWGCGGHSSTL